MPYLLHQHSTHYPHLLLQIFPWFQGLLETATNNISNLTNKPSHLVINRGNLILLSDQQMRRTYSVTATLDILDSDLSAE